MAESIFHISLWVSFLAISWWGCGNAYEALVVAPQQLKSWQRGQRPGLDIDPRIYYFPAVALGLSGLVVSTVLAFRIQFSAEYWILAAGILFLTAMALTAYAVKTINLELFYAKSGPSAERGLLLMKRWVRLNIVRLLLSCSILGVLLRALVRLAA